MRSHGLWIDFLVTYLFKFNSKAEGGWKHFLITVALVFPFLPFLLLFSCLEFFLQKTLSVAMEFWFAAILTKFFGNVVAVKIKARIHKETGEVCTYHRKQKTYRDRPF